MAKKKKIIKKCKKKNTPCVKGTSLVTKYWETFRI